MMKLFWVSQHPMSDGLISATVVHHSVWRYSEWPLLDRNRIGGSAANQDHDPNQS